MPLIPLTPQDLEKVKIKIPKRYFSLPAFWSSPDILDFTPEQYIWIALKNACSYLTVFDLAELFGIDNVEILWNKIKSDFGKRCFDYIENAILLYREREIVLNKEVEIDLKVKKNIDIKEKILLWVDNKNFNDLYDVASLIKNSILTPKEFINTIKKHRLTYEENYILNAIKNTEVPLNDENLKKVKKYFLNEIEKEMLKSIEKKFARLGHQPLTVKV